MVRLIGHKLTDIWHPPVIIQDHGGAAGALRAQVVARLRSDGYRAAEDVHLDNVRRPQDARTRAKTC